VLVVVAIVLLQLLGNAGFTTTDTEQR